MANSSTPIPFSEKLGYSFGDVASNFFFKSFLVYLMYFYTDVYGISVSSVTFMFAATRFWDMINDPVMGAIADRTKTKWGKFRPYLLWLSVPYAVSGLLLYTTPDLGEQGKLIWAWVTYMLMMMVYTGINIPYSALMGVMTTDPGERSSLAGYRMAGANIAGAIVEASTLFLVAYLGSGDEQTGFQRTFGLFGLITIFLWVGCFKLTKERIKPAKESSRQSFWSDVKDLGQNRPFIILFFIGIFSISTVAVRLGSQMYYFKYFIGRTEMGPLFMAWGTIVWVLGAMSTKFWVNTTGNKRMVFFTSMAVNGVLTFLFVLLGPSDISLLYILNAATSFASGVSAPLIWAMYAEAADYSEWKNGRRATGLVVSAGVFSQKFGWFIGPLITGTALAYFGFEANAEQTPELKIAIVWMMSIIPGLGSVFAGALIFLYKIDEKLFDQIQVDLNSRRDDD